MFFMFVEGVKSQSLHAQFLDRFKFMNTFSHASLCEPLAHLCAKKCEVFSTQVCLHRTHILSPEQL